MTIVSSILLTLGIGPAWMSASVSPGDFTYEKIDTNQTPQAAPANRIVISVITPQKDLESAIRNSEQGDILLMGPDGWYRIEGKTLQQGTKMYVLGGKSSIVGTFPKEADQSTTK